MGRSPIRAPVKPLAATFAAQKAERRLQVRSIDKLFHPAACGYKIGHNDMLRERDHARAALGRRFALADFVGAISEAAGVPLTISSKVIGR
jgi:hypothetical protein